MSKTLLESLAKLEHEQWMAWSKSIAASEKISEERLERWKKLWVEYEDLPEWDKEKDRVWARRAIGKMLDELKRSL